MLRIEVSAWAVMVEHAEAAYPRECCGVMIGTEEGVARVVMRALAGRNAYEGDQSDRFELDPGDTLRAEREARAAGLEVLGFFHSHPDHGMYFSNTDRENAWPWYSNVVMAVRGGVCESAGCFRVNGDRTVVEQEELEHPPLGG
jgi:proteasome lid subunit RPN8/RPN11